jgi:meso-butanediol dehydrogenase/(S,S)-butanediol dehydrogenase/diacetyl reductase
LQDSIQQSHSFTPGMSDEQYLKRLVQDTVTRFGKLDVLVNNAGFARPGMTKSTSAQEWEL